MHCGKSLRHDLSAHTSSGGEEGELNYQEWWLNQPGLFSTLLSCSNTYLPFIHQVSVKYPSNQWLPLVSTAPFHYDILYQVLRYCFEFISRSHRATSRMNQEASLLSLLCSYSDGKKTMTVTRLWTNKLIWNIYSTVKVKVKEKAFVHAQLEIAIFGMSSATFLLQTFLSWCASQSKPSWSPSPVRASLEQIYQGLYVIVFSSRNCASWRLGTAPSWSILLANSSKGTFLVLTSGLLSIRSSCPLTWGMQKRSLLSTTKMRAWQSR